MPHETNRTSGPCKGASITPALLFTFVFNTLLISARRLVYQAFHKAAAGAPGALEIGEEKLPGRDASHLEDAGRRLAAAARDVDAAPEPGIPGAE